MKKKITAGFIRGTAAAALPALAAGFLLLVYAPVEVYVTNTEGFLYDLYDLLKLMLPLFAVFAAGMLVLFALLGAIGKKAVTAGSAAALWMLLALYVQGTFFAGDLPPLDGRVIDWSEYVSGRLPSVCVWLGAAAVVLLSLRLLGGEKWRKAAAAVSGLMLGMLLVSAVLVSLPGDGLKNKSDRLVTDSGLLDLSETENFLILLTDCIGGPEFEEVLEERPELAERLEDFTFFRNTVGSYPFTQHAVPYILCGEWYENGESFFTYRDRAYRDSPLFAALRERGYRIGVYTQELPASEEAVGDVENTVDAGSGRFSEPLEFIKTQLKLAGLKYFPFDGKKYCLVAPDYLYVNSLKEHGAVAAYDWTNLAFYDAVRGGSVSVGPEKCFRFIHISGAHDPFIYDPEMNVVEQSCYTDCIEATMTCVDSWLELLKAAGCYEDSVIMIMADHGYLNDTRQVPLLLVKGRNEHHAYAVSDAPVSHEDLQETYVRLLDGASAEDAFPWREGDVRDRRYLDYLFYYEDDMKELIQHGFASDPGTLEETGNRYVREGEHITSHSFFDFGA